MRELIHFLDNHAGAFQVLASVFIAGLTLCLVAVTAKYVSITNKSLSVSQKQFDELTRVDVLLRMTIVPTTLSDQEANMELINLSGRGILWDKLIISVKALRTDKNSEAVVVPVEKVVPAYGMESVPCVKHFWQAYRTTSELDSPGRARVSVVAVVRGGKNTLATSYESPEVLLSPGSIYEC